jgi:lipopolysaccharide/colanic/teichoic acid biosynthesis glycosyltransferase
LKRAFDIITSLVGLIIFIPVLLPIMVIIWSYDFHTPFYIAQRVGKHGKLFRMIKFRSMIINADKSGIVSTSANDKRLTPIGRFIRKYKFDELVQLINVLIGDMSLVGPRPNVLDEVNLYSKEELKILKIKPGITDLSSIVFSDLNEILKNQKNLNLFYNQFVRPWKSRLALLYVSHNNFYLDLRIIFITIIGLLNKEKSLVLLNKILIKITTDAVLIQVATRKDKLFAYPPPGEIDIVKNR